MIFLCRKPEINFSGSATFRSGCAIFKLKFGLRKFFNPEKFSKSKLQLKWRIRIEKLRIRQKIAYQFCKTAHPPTIFPKCLPFLPLFLPLQIPVCIVSKGAVPQMRKERFTMVQSCHTTLLEEADFKDMHKNAYPIVVCYNGRDHFTPTRPSSQSKFLKWKLNKELGPIVSAALLVIEELDRPKLSPAVLTAVNQLEDTIVQTLPTISPTPLSSHLKAVAAWNKAGALHRGPVL